MNNKENENLVELITRQSKELLLQEIDRAIKSGHPEIVETLRLVSSENLRHAISQIEEMRKIKQ